MANNLEPASDEIEAFRNVIPDIGAPTVVSANYVFDVDCYLVTRAGSVDYERIALNGDKRVHLRGELIEGLGSAAATLGWIELKARAEVVLSSSEAAVELGQHDWLATQRGDISEETVLFHRFGLGEQMFAVGYDSATGQTELMARSEVLKGQTLSPYMEAWLTRIASPYRNIGFETIPYRERISPFVEWIKMDRKL